MPDQPVSLRACIANELPYLRRYARAVTGSQSFGDAAVREMLEAIIAAPDLLDEKTMMRLGLFRVFHQIWKPTQGNSGSGGFIANLPVSAREALLLTMVEGFSCAQTAEILKTTQEQVRATIALARQQLEAQLHASVMIIEDEAIIAMHLRKIVEGLGNTVAGVVPPTAGGNSGGHSQVPAHGGKGVNRAGEWRNSVYPGVVPPDRNFLRLTVASQGR